MPTRTVYRQASARALGTLHLGTVVADSTPTLLRTDAWPFKSAIPQDERWEHWFLHRPTVPGIGTYDRIEALGSYAAMELYPYGQLESMPDDRVRTVTSGGYDPNAGTFVPDLPWAGEPTPGEPFELMGMLDPADLHRLVNDALKLIPVTVEITLQAPSATARRLSLASAAPWLTDPDDVYQVGVLGPGDVRSDVDPFSRVVRGQATERGGVVYLEGVCVTTTDTVYVLCARSASSYCRASGGAYGDLTSGLTAETDEAAVEEEVVAAGVKMLAWDEFRELFWPGDGQVAERKVAQASDRFWSLVRDSWREPTRRFTPLRSWGPPMRARTPVG